jgi:hypothetical protein
MRKLYTLLLGCLFTLSSQADCLKEYQQRAKNKRDKLNRQMERYVMGTWIAVNGHYVRLESQGSNPKDFYNNYEEDILLLATHPNIPNDGAKEIISRVNKKFQIPNNEMAQILNLGFKSGALCDKKYGVMNRKQAARYIISQLKDVQSIVNNPSSKIYDSLEDKSVEIDSNQDSKESNSSIK